MNNIQNILISIQYEGNTERRKFSFFCTPQCIQITFQDIVNVILVTFVIIVFNSYQLYLVCAAQRLLWYKFAFNRARDLRQDFDEEIWDTIMMIVECQTRRQIDFKREDKIDKITPHSHCFLSPQSTRCRTPSTWRPSQCCLFRLPCSRRSSSTNDAPLLRKIYQIKMKISSIIHTSKTKFHN